LVSKVQYNAFSVNVIVSSALEKMWKEVVVVYFETVFPVFASED
jgi:hypothetical protein